VKKKASDDLSRAEGIGNADLHEMVDEVRRAAWRRAGEQDTVRRLRTDKGFARAVVEHAVNIVASQRAHLFRDAMNAAQRNRVTFERNLREGKGLWFDELLPLAPKERTHLLATLRKNWDVPETPVAPTKTLQ
jgi:hypothetical protein